MSILNWDFDNYLLRSDTDWAYWTCKSREDLDPKKETSSLRDTSITSMYPKRIGFFVQGHCRFLRGIGGTAAEGAVANLWMKSVDFWRYPFVDSKCINRGLCSNPIPHDSCWNVALPLRPAQDCAWCELCFVLNRHERWLKFHMRISRCKWRWRDQLTRKGWLGHKMLWRRQELSPREPENEHGQWQTMG